MQFLLLLVLQDSAVERYLMEKDKAARARILAEIKAPLAEVEAQIRKPPARPAATGGEIVRRKLKAAHPLGGEFEIHLWVPKAYTPEKRWRLLVSLHGSGGNGGSHIQRWLEEIQRAGDTILLCPTAGRGGWGRSLLGHAYVRTALREVMDSYAIDPDLVFLDGTSMGGNGSFELACQYPDLFAGAAPRSGGPLFRYSAGPEKADRTVTAEHLENLLALPLYWVVGAKDDKMPYEWVKAARAQIESMKLDFTYREYPEGGHEWFPAENPKVLEWMGTKRRDACPARAGVSTRERAFNRNFWLEITEFKGKDILKRSYLDTDKKTIEERTLFPELSIVTAECLRETNEIRVSAAGAREIRIYLHEKMVDFGKPLIVTVNGTKSRPDVKPSLETLLESARRDRGLLYTASVRVRVP